MPPSKPVQPDPGPLPGQLYGVLEPIVTGAGFELDDLDVRVAGRRHTVKVIVDSDGGVGLDALAGLSRSVSAELDRHEHLINGSYTLEVTSPGAERPLTKQRHWQRAHLRKVAVTTTDGKKFTGRVGTAGPESVVVLVDGKKRELRFADVRRAAVEVEFKPAPEAELRALGAARPAQAEEGS
ncbi:ribosome maturation factor RimP [Pseudonocardia sp. CA-107938]|uniref:ribosome maturation factor RimP n=1 Tax=Pseudonocardia sp. CA-107938 TaxID=3240021 RepID=UPI003D9159BD